MYAFFLSFLLLASSPFQTTEKYYIVHLKGRIVKKATNVTLKVGDQVSANDQLRFITPQSSAVVISNKRGRFTLGRPASASSAQGEFLALVRNALVPVKSTGQLSTRGNEAVAISNLKDVLGSSDKATYAFLGDNTKLLLSTSAYPMNKSRYFIYHYDYKGTPVSKRVGFNRDTLYIEKQQLYNVKGEQADPVAAGEVSLYYYNEADKSSKRYLFTPVFVPEENLKAELGTLIDFYKGQKLPKDTIQKALLEHVTEVHGRTDRAILEHWVNKHFTLL